MVKLGQPLQIRAAKYQTRYVSGDGRFSINVFTAVWDENVFPDGLDRYGTTCMFTACGKVHVDESEKKDADKGTEYYLFGSWEKDKKKKGSVIFEVTKSSVALPEKEKQIVAFLTRKCRGVGKVTAEKTASVFGKDTITICARQPQRIVAEVPGIKQRAADTMTKACRQALVLIDFERILGEADVPEDVLSKLADEFGDKALDVAKGNAYQFCACVGFENADKIAIALGEPRDSERRIGAALYEAVGVVCRKTGCMCADGAATLSTASEMLGTAVSAKAIRAKLSKMCHEYDLVLQGTFLYYKEDLVTERTLAHNVANFVGSGAQDEERIEESLRKWQENHEIVLSERQANAVRNLKYHISIVTGGPGTGKTTTLRAIMDVYRDLYPAEEVLLMAPTGLAAKRMTDSTGHSASTIHSACGLVPANNASGFSSQDGCTITAGFVGIDEMSMVGEHLFSFAMDAIKNQPCTRVVLLGDVDQLGPVSRGDVLNDLIHCGAVPTTVLDCNYRQGKDSTITDACVKIREDRAYSGSGCNLTFDEELRLRPVQNNDKRTEADQIIETVVSYYLKGVEKFGQKGAIILTPTHYDRGTPSGFLCKDVLNRVIQEKVNPDDGTKATCKCGGQLFRVGDRIIQRKNTSVAINGDLGTIVGIRSDDGDLVVSIAFDSADAPLEYDRKQLHEVELAYAITVHSSQGCEFPCCVIPVSSTFSVMLSRAIYYTAISRARERCVLVGDGDALKRAIQNKKREERKSHLGPRIIKYVEGTSKKT